MRRILDLPAIYKLWQAPLVRQKVAPFLSRVDPANAGRVIDVGCGPGTNAALFSPSRYLGIDTNARYVAYARRTHPHRFEACDLRDAPSDLGLFDLAFVNSVFHHLTDSDSLSLLSSLRRYLVPEATIHIIDLVLPATLGIPRLLALWDRGAYARPATVLKGLVEQEADLAFFLPYRLKVGSVPLWELIYIEATLKGRG